MTPVYLACLWCLLANVIAMFPSKHHHWPAAYVLITFGVPILLWVYVSAGILLGLVFTAAGASILRWPVRYLLRWISTKTVRRVET